MLRPRLSSLFMVFLLFVVRSLEFKTSWSPSLTSLQVQDLQYYVNITMQLGNRHAIFTNSTDNLLLYCHLHCTDITFLSSSIHLCASFCLFNILCRGFHYNAASSSCRELDAGLDLKQATPDQGTMIVVDYSVVTGID